MRSLLRAALVALALSPLGIAALLPASGQAPVAQAAAVTVDGFDFPVGPPDGATWVVTQAFQENDHLGEDWNGPGGGDSDLGDPVHAIAHGVVADARDLGDNGWGRVVRVVHTLPDGREVESLYAHLDRMDVVAGEQLRRGQALGTVGTAHGRYKAHLHFELRSMARLPVGAGYGSPDGLYLDPSAWIAQRRPDRSDPRRW